MTAVQGQSVDVATPAGVADSYLVAPADGVPRPGVLLYMDAFGPRPSLRAMADRLAGHGYTVLVPNVFYRHGRAPVVELPEFIDPQERPDIFQQLLPMILELTPDIATADARAYLDALAASDRTAPGPIGITGYCMGARLALHTAAAFPERVAAVAGFHGGGLVTDNPDSPHLALGNLTAELYLGHADNDPSMPVEKIERLERTLDDAGVRYRSEVYPGAHHGYTQTDTAAYDEQAAERHWRELLALLDRNLTPAT
ncbi:dienelactone hydrolase family protein [Nocardia blacklockiae]|uniref:dienelactone hydrolase family protein n=1 Tax=Nocardia blacklockiae TaxID=480036 RepID=UPI001896009B|nr:dienelactone hydrolase family protein [Nocardia blacklockiae]MBF6171717.1 dienelactone hydrolase family protein [Nocardia blacklockiae]